MKEIRRPINNEIKMANVKFNREIFEKEIAKIDDALLEKIALFGTPVESVDDDEIELEVFPNRPDVLSYQGFKRAFLAFLGKKGFVGLKNYKINKPLKNYKVVVDDSVKEVRPFTVCAIVKNLDLNDEKIKDIIGIQEKLHFTVGRKRKKLAIGVYPLDKITLPISYKALEPDKIKFRPLESEKEMSGLQILQRHPTGRDYAHLLAGKNKFPIFVDSKDEVLSMPPIINSHLTGRVTLETKDVFVECSGNDLDILKKALNIVVSTLADFSSKVEVYQMEVLYGKKKEITPDFKFEKMKLKIENVNGLLGLVLKEKEIKDCLEMMGYGYDKGEVLIPSWRTDILHEVDLIEDVAIAYGYENFVPEIPSVSSIGEESLIETKKRKISEILVGLDFLEVSNFHLTRREDMVVKMGLMDKNEKVISVKDSKTDYTLLRKNLSHYLMKNLSENVDVEYPHRIFEIGNVFLKSGTGNVFLNGTGGVLLRSGTGESNKVEEIEEKESLALALTPGNFTDMKQVLNYLFKMVNKSFVLKEPSDNEFKHFIGGRVAEIFVDEKKVGVVGEIHPKILKNWKLKMPVVLCELDLAVLV